MGSLRILIKLVQQYPLAASVTQAMVLSIIDNTIVQIGSKLRAGEQVSLNFRLTFISIICAILLTPLNYLWQLYLERKFPGWERRSASSSIAMPIFQDSTSNRYIDRDIDDADVRSEEAEDSHPLQRTHKLVDASDLLAAMEEDVSGPGEREYSGQTRLNVRNTVSKFALDNTIGLVFNVVMYLSLWALMKGGGWNAVWVSLQNKTGPVVLNALMVWPLSSVISLTVVPVEMRMIFYTTIGFFWDIYMNAVAMWQ